MKTIDDLRDYYNSALVKDLSLLETKRKGIVKNLIYAAIPITGILTVFALFIIRSSQDPGVLIIFAALSLFIFAAVYYFFTRDYVREFKSAIIHKIVKFIDSGLDYSRERCIGESVFKESRIFKNNIDRYRGDDYVSGKIGATEVKFSEIHAEYVTRDSKGRRTYHTIFKGIFFIADFNKSFKGKTVVLPDTAERLFGHIGSMLQSWNFTRGQLIKLDDPEFEKIFAVYGDDQIVARYILSTSLMKRITDFKKKTKRQIYLSFISQNVYVAISYTRNLFEPRVFKTLLDFNPIKEYYNDLALAVGIVEDLNLNTRIWSK
ncbi:MAG: DUF3137 domain-containing protein [Candidatus Omnitrophota bacterium]